jgi:hypothetical protein
MMAAHSDGDDDTPAHSDEASRAQSLQNVIEAILKRERTEKETGPHVSNDWQEIIRQTRHSPTACVRVHGMLGNRPCERKKKRSSPSLPRQQGRFAAALELQGCG